jgi:hypothetical protein
MPFTPYHFGPGLLAKAVLSRRFSLTTFVLTQVVIDVETGYHLLHNEWPLHRTFHTMLAGAAAGVVLAVLVRIAGSLVGCRYRDSRLTLLMEHECALPAALVGGILGGASHSLLDAIVHSDVRPYRPLVAGNPLLGMIGAGALHFWCIVTGVVAAVVLIARAARRRRGS